MRYDLDANAKRTPEELTENKAHVVGTVYEKFTKSHEQGEKKFYKTIVAVPRKSGNIDFLPLVIASDLISGNVEDIPVGKFIEVWGRFCSFAKYDSSKSHFIERYIFVNDCIISSEEGDLENPVGTNEFFMNGEIKSDPVIRETPLGRIITEFYVLSHRKSKKCDRIPCIAWGGDAIEIAEYGAKTQIQVTGRIQSRIYTKKTLDSNNQEVETEKTAYEVSVRNYAILALKARIENKIIMCDSEATKRVYA